MKPLENSEIKAVLERMLQVCDVVRVHFDPRAEGVHVPGQFRADPLMSLEVGLNLPIPIRDLEIGEAGLYATLSFNRTPYYCEVPFAAFYAIDNLSAQTRVLCRTLPSPPGVTPKAEPGMAPVVDLAAYRAKRATRRVS